MPWSNRVGFNVTVSLAAMLLCSSCHGNESRVARTVTLCEADEHVFFSCATAKGKTISLCGSVQDGDGERLHYRFGTVSKIELAYPVGDSSGSGFFHNRYVRPRADYLEVGFADNSYEYRVYRHYDADLEDLPRFGITVRGLDDDSAESRIPCASEPIDNLLPLSDSLPCNGESALGCIE